MNDMSLSRLYRRLASAQPLPEMEGTDLAAVASADAQSSGLSARHQDAVVAKLAGSTKYADLARMLRALEPASEALATDVSGSRRSAHAPRGRELRPAAGARRHQGHLRWAGVAAACFAFAIGVGTWRSIESRHQAVVAQSAPSATDRIFASNDRIFSDAGSNGAHSQHHDEVFRGGFAAGG
jgi:hypothetical protein